MPLSSRWVRSRWSDSIYHAKLVNYRDETRHATIELEADSSGAVWPTLRVGGETIPVNGGESLPGFDAAACVALKALRKLFQTRRKSGLVAEFIPFDTDRKFAAAYGISQSTANGWRRGNKVISRRSVNQICASLGFVFSGLGGGEKIELHDPIWKGEPDA